MKMKKVIVLGVTLASCYPALGKDEAAARRGKVAIDSVCTLSAANEYPSEVAFANKFPSLLYWCPSKSINGKIELEGGIGRDGRIYNLQLVGNGEDPQSNAECVEAISSAAPFPNVPDGRGKLFSIGYTFDDKQTYFRKALEIDKFFLEHLADKKNSVLIHRIPVSVLKKFPNTFEEKQIFSGENLVAVKFTSEQLAISNRCYLDPISAFYTKWTDFFLSHKQVSAKDIEAAAEQICAECSLTLAGK